MRKKEAWSPVRSVIFSIAIIIQRKGNYLVLITIGVLRFCFSIFSLGLVLIEKIYQNLKAVFHYILNNSKFVKNTSLRVVYSTPFSVFENALAWSFVLDIFDVLDIHLITDKIGLQEALLPINHSSNKI